MAPLREPATFTRDFDYRVPGKPATIAYKRGWSGIIPRAHIEAAKKAGALAKEIPDARRRKS